jgi:hypothetical protein
MKTRALFVWNLYRDSLHARPLTTKSFTAATLSAVSDVVCQRLESSSRVPLPKDNRDDGTLATAPTAIDNHDWLRTFQVGLVGLLWTGPIAHTWYNLLERLVVHVPRPRSAFVARLILDATLFSPVAGT